MSSESDRSSLSGLDFAGDSPEYGPQSSERTAHGSRLTAHSSQLTAHSYITSNLPLLLDVLRGSDVSELEIKEGGVVVRLHRAQPLDGPPGSENLLERQDAILAEPSSTEITSPLVGTFYRSGEPDMPPLVEEGTRVEDDSVVGIVEVLNQPTEVEAGCSGVVTKVLAEDGQPVQYGQPLFEVSAVG